MTLVRSFFCLNVLQSSVLYQQSRSRKKVFYRHIHPQDIYGQQQLVILHQMYQQSQTLLESIENMAAFVNQFAWHQIFLNYMHGLKSAVLEFFQNGLRWPCPAVIVSLNNASQHLKYSFLFRVPMNIRLEGIIRKCVLFHVKIF